MVTINNINPEHLKKAVIAWSGFGNTSYPIRSEAALASALTKDEALSLMPIIVALETDYYKSKAYLTAPSLVEAGMMASEEFKKVYPHLPDEIAQVFEWCYTFDYK